MENGINPYDKLKPIIITAVIFLINYTFILNNNLFPISKKNNFRHLAQITQNDFFSNISDSNFVGNWNSIETPLDFEKNKGIIDFRMNRKTKGLNNDIIDVVYVRLFIRDEEYFDRWYSIRGKYDLNQGVNIFDFNSNTLTMTFNTTILEGKLFDIVSDNFGSYF
jgi:hypothetical protein